VFDPFTQGVITAAEAGSLLRLDSLTVISIILGSGALPASLSNFISTSSVFRVPLAPGSAIERVISREARLAESVLVTFPSSSPPPSWLRPLSENVVWLPVPEHSENRSIGYSVFQALDFVFSKAGAPNHEIRIVYGDTITDIVGKDIVAVGHTTEPEDWSYAPENLTEMRINSRTSDKEPRVITGLFSFSDGKLFYELLKGQNVKLSSKRGFEPFYFAIQEYAKSHPGSLQFKLDEDWQDYGHLNTYMSARKAFMEGRNVNSFGASEKSLFITKNSSRRQKLRNEAVWFRDIPDELFRFLPRVVLPPSMENYQVQFIPAITLSEKILYGETELIDWEFIHKALENWLSEAASFVISSEEDGQSQFEPKWFEEYFSDRLEQVVSEGSLNQKISAVLKTEKHIIDQAVASVSTLMRRQQSVVVHGDLIMSNVLVSERDRLFKLIDPRGGFSSQSIYGPPLYEWAKMAQSIFGRYEEILCGEYLWIEGEGLGSVSFFEDSQRSSNYEKMQLWFERTCPNLSEAIRLAGLLLISAVPFHLEDPKRSLAMISRGLEMIEAA
jgi:hypothetical protein